MSGYHGRESTACEGDISIPVVGNGVGGRKMQARWKNALEKKPLQVDLSVTLNDFCKV